MTWWVAWAWREQGDQQDGYRGTAEPPLGTCHGSSLQTVCVDTLHALAQCPGLPMTASATLHNREIRGISYVLKNINIPFVYFSFFGPVDII